MNKVIEALEHMAENGGYWTHDSHAGVWHLSLGGARSNPYGVGFSQDDVIEFLRHYEELSKPPSNIFGVCSEGDETDEELIETLNRLDGKQTT